MFGCGTYVCIPYEFGGVAHVMHRCTQNESVIGRMASFIVALRKIKSNLNDYFIISVVFHL